MKDPENPKRWIVDEEAAVNVRRIFRMAMDGYGIMEIAYALDRDGVLTPLSYLRSKGMNRGGRRNADTRPTAWKHAMIYKMLALQEYCGDVINFKSFSKSYRNKKRIVTDEKDRAIFWGVHEAIIERGEWEKVQERYGSRKRQPTKSSERSVFAGLLKCSTCGKNLNFHFNQGNYDIKYFNCPTHNAGRGGCDATHYIRVNFLEQVVLQEIQLAQMRGTTFSMRLTEMPYGTATELINRQSSNKRSETYKTKLSEQVRAEEELKVIHDFYRDMLSNKSKIYYTNIYIEVYGRDKKELYDTLAALKAKMSAQHITYQELLYEQQEGFDGVSPIGKDTLFVSSNNVPSTSLAAFYPFSFSSRNDPRGMLLGNTVDGGLMQLDIWGRSSSITNSSIVVIGESGFGKSYLLKKMIAQQAARGTTVFCIDPDAEYLQLFAGLGGTAINCATGNIKINPLEIRALKSDESHAEIDSGIDALRQKSAFFQHLSWLEDFFKILYPDIRPREVAALLIFVKDLYYASGITENTDLGALTSEKYPIFTDLYALVEKVYEDKTGADKYSMVSKETRQDLLLLLRSVRDGSLSPLFNGYTNIQNANLICFNMQELLNGAQSIQQAMIFNIMTYMWGRVMRRENQTMLVVDEVAKLVNPQNYTAGIYLKDFMKRARKYNGSIVIATQQLRDLADSEIRHIAAALFNTPSFRFMFNPGTLELQLVRELLTLGEGEMALLRGMPARRCLMFAGEDKYNLETGTLKYESELFGEAGGL